MADLLPSIPKLDISYNKDDADNSAREIACLVNPSWKSSSGSGDDDLKIKTFTEGITNTMLKISAPSLPSSTPIVLRAFGPGAEPLTSRPREIALHALLSSYDLAPALLARFKNGIVYAFTPGTPCDSKRLHEERVYRGVARTLGNWHGRLPVGIEGTRVDAGEGREGSGGEDAGDELARELQRENPPGDIWAVMRTWASRMPEADEGERRLKEELRGEVEFAWERLAGLEGLGGQKLVMGHCDLLAGNVLVQDDDDEQHNENTKGPAQVQLIDYEYSVTCPAAFDIALHFGEWPGFECDYRQVSDRSTRRRFISEYVKSWNEARQAAGKAHSSEQDEAKEVKIMEELVDRFRGLPGLWFALWGFVQAHDSSEEFDYRDYAGTRLSGEYQVWKRWEENGRPGDGGFWMGDTKEGSKAKNSGEVREAHWWS